MRPIRVVIVEDEDDDYALLLRALARSSLKMEFRRVVDADGFSAALLWGPQVVIADYSLPGYSAGAALSHLAGANLDIPMLVVSGSVGEETAVGLMRAGAADCVMKSGLSRLAPAVERALRDAEVRRRQRETDEALRRFAWMDEETGLPNRPRLVEVLRLRLAAGEALTLGLLTPDRASDVQRTLGHRVADQMMLGLARRLTRAAASVGWFVARVAPREFGVIIPAGGERAAESLVRDLDHVDVFGTLTLDVRMRMGTVHAAEDPADPHGLLRRAETALDQAARSGRTLALYSPETDPWSPRRLALLNDLGHAVARGELSLVCQPRVDLRTRRTTGFEALLRWQHPSLGRVPPDEFIPLAEGTGQIHALTRWVVDAAVRLVAHWRASGMSPSIGVNVSARSLTEVDLVGDLRRALSAHGLPPDCLDVEVTESVLMTDPARARAVLTELQNFGVKVFLDDFGMGYSSLGYLRNLPLHALKIDRVFVMGGVVERNDVSIVQATVQLAHNLGLRVVAEGVETEGALTRLAELGCDEVQGYHLARPMVAEAVPGWLSDSPWGLGGTVQ